MKRKKLSRTQQELFDAMKRGVTVKQPVGDFGYVRSDTQIYNRCTATANALMDKGYAVWKSHCVVLCDDNGDPIIPTGEG